VSIFALQFALGRGLKSLRSPGKSAKVDRLERLGAEARASAMKGNEWSRVRFSMITGGAGVDHVVENGGAGTIDESIKPPPWEAQSSLVGLC